MTTEQIHNVIDLCKGASVGSVLRLMDLYREDDIKDFANYFSCNPTKESVAARLLLGR